MPTRCAYAASISPNTNSKSNTEFKNTAKDALLYGPGGAWQLVNICQAAPDMNNDLRAQLNIRIPDGSPTPVPIPTERPNIDPDFEEAEFALIVASDTTHRIQEMHLAIEHAIAARLDAAHHGFVIALHHTVCGGETGNRNEITDDGFHGMIWGL